MKKLFKIVFFVLIAAFLAAQFVRAERTNPPVDPSLEYRAPAHIQPILDRACMDCHSNRTRWPWYSNITPASFFVVDHVNEGREQLSFSELGGYDAEQAAHAFDEICGEVKQGHMPMPEYLWLHRSAKLSLAEKHALCEWADGEERRFGSGVR
jgi:Haem-binding domain